MWIAMAGRAWGVGQGLGLFGPLIRELGYATNRLFTNSLPSPNDAVAAFRKGYLSSTALQMVANSHGIFPPAQAGRQNPTWKNAQAWRAVWDSQRFMIDGMEAYRLWRAGKIDIEKRNKIYKQNAIWNDDGREMLAMSFDTNIPGPETIINFAVKEAFDEDVVRQFGYDQEFPAIFGELMRQIGWGGRPTLPGQRADQPLPPEWAKLHWRAHWNTISPSQAYEMFQRLRPNRLARWGNQIAGLRAFTFNDVSTVLRIADYPVPFRAQLAAISYRKPRLVDIDRFYKTGQIDRQEVYELHLDLGYSPADAEMRTNWLVMQRASVPQDRASKLAADQTVTLYSLGTMHREDAMDSLIRIYSGGLYEYNSPAPNDANQRRVYNEVRRQSRARLAAADQAEQIKQTRRMLSVWRKRYTGGIINEGQLRGDMAAGGFEQAFIRRFVQRLNLELAGGKAMFSTSKVRELVLDGVLPFSTAKTYLGNLGWREPELSWILSQLQQDQRIAEEAVLERQARDEQSRAAAQERQLRALEAMKEKVIKRLNKNASDAQLKRYYVRGIISEQRYRRELGIRNLEADAISQRIADAQIDRDKYVARQARQRATGNPTGQKPQAREDAQPGN